VSDFLDEMARSSRQRASTLRARSAALHREAARAETPFPLALDAFGVIAEIKPRAPSAGVLAAADVASCVARAEAYAHGGAACVSVLTEPTRFDGSNELLATIADALRPHRVGAMRKDFLVDPLQVVEARALGASGVLLITRMLDDARLGEMLDAARSLGLFALIEAFDESDLARSMRVIGGRREGVFLGVNCRDLATLAIDRARLTQLALPRDIDVVAESGIEVPEHVREIVQAGYRGALIGTTLMRASDPSAAVRAITEAASCT